MNKVIIKFALAICLQFFFAFEAFAQTNTNHVYVSGYTKSNGTVVQGYYRTAPNSTNRDNFSTVGNTNPYTGQPGYIQPDNNNTTTTSSNYSYNTSSNTSTTNNSSSSSNNSNSSTSNNSSSTNYLSSYYRPYSTTTKVNLRSGPGTEYSVTDLISTGVTVIVAYPPVDGWAYVSINGEFGYMYYAYLKQLTQ